MYSEIGDKYVVGVAIYVSYHLLDNSRAFITVLSAIISHSSAAILKSYYHEARPFYVADFQPNGCLFQYGNPSGHS